MTKKQYKSKGCEHYYGIYGIEESDGVVRCPLCGAETIGHYRDMNREKLDDK